MEFFFEGIPYVEEGPKLWNCPSVQCGHLINNTKKHHKIDHTDQDKSNEALLQPARAN